MKADVDLHMMLYLNEEAGGKEKNTLFIISHEQIVELERSITEYRKVEAQSLRALHEASSSRDRAARQSSVQVLVRMLCCMRELCCVRTEGWGAREAGPRWAEGGACR